MRGKPFLGAQCWTCRQRRVRCGSERPACASCRAKDLDCLGYSPTKPVRWRPVSLLPPSPAPACLVDVASPSVIDTPRGDDVGTPLIALETLYYYNQTIGRDIGAVCAADEFVSPAEWLEYPLAKRYMFMCLTQLHKIVQTLPPHCDTLESLPWHALAGPSRQDIARFSQSQAEAVRIVQGQLEKSSASASTSTYGPAAREKPDADLFAGLVGLLMSHIQQGAFGMWRAHLQGAKALLNRWGPADLSSLDDEDYFILLTVDLYHCTTAESRQLPAQAWDQHRAYIEQIPHFAAMAAHSLTPVATELLTAVALANMRRMRGHDPAQPLPQGGQVYYSTASAILELLQSFQPERWLETVLPAADASGSPGVRHPSPGVQHEQYASWLSLAECFRSATLLYLFLIRSPANDVPDLETDPVLTQQRTDAYLNLTNSIAHLFALRKADPTTARHHKFVAWPMVVAGIEAIVTHRDEGQVGYLCAYLRLLALELGTFTMRQAARFLEDLAGRYRKKRAAGYEYRGQADWDDMFTYGAIFLL